MVKRTWESYIDRELDSLRKAYEAGAEAAVLDALLLCTGQLPYFTSKPVPIPEWLAEAAREQSYRYLTDKRPKRVGRAGNERARFRQDMIDYCRFDTVREVRDKQIEFADQHKALQSMKGVSQEELQASEERLFQIGKTLDDAIAFAPRLLRKTKAAGSEHSVRRSYNRVRRMYKDPVKVWKFHQLSAITYRLLGLKDIFEPPRGTRFDPLFD